MAHLVVVASGREEGGAQVEAVVRLVEGNARACRWLRG